MHYTLTDATLADLTDRGDAAPTSRRLPDGDQRSEWRIDGTVAGVPVSAYCLLTAADEQAIADADGDASVIDWDARLERVEINLAACDRAMIPQARIDSLLSDYSGAGREIDSADVDDGSHIPAPGRAAGLHGTAMCGAWADYGTGDHDAIRRAALADATGYCPECLARLRASCAAHDRRSTRTHYTDAHGQHELPACLLNRTLAAGDVIVAADEWEAMDASDTDDIRHACRAIGIAVDLDDDGALVVVGHE